MLPLDDRLHALRATIPHLTRSSLHRRLQRHGASRLPEAEGDKPGKRQFKAHAIGHLHIDLAGAHTGQGRLHPLVAIDRTAKFALVDLHERLTQRMAGDFLRALTEVVPHRVHTALTDNGTHLATPGNTASAAPPTDGRPVRKDEPHHQGSGRPAVPPREPRPTQAAPRRLRRRLKTLKGPTPYEYICTAWQREPSRFAVDPTHQMPGPNI